METHLIRQWQGARFLTDHWQRPLPNRGFCFLFLQYLCALFSYARQFFSWTYLNWVWVQTQTQIESLPKKSKTTTTISIWITCRCFVTSYLAFLCLSPCVHKNTVTGREWKSERERNALKTPHTPLFCLSFNHVLLGIHSFIRAVMIVLHWMGSICREIHKLPNTNNLRFVKSDVQCFTSH